MPEVSVVLATYNGSRYLAEQFQTVVDQTMPADEIIIADDASTDGTQELILGWAAEHPSVVRPLLGTERLGVVGNFERAILAATGDIVFLCDQDDLWEPDKVELMTAVMRETSAGAAFSDGALFGEARAGTLWPNVGFTAREQRRWEDDPLGILLRQNVVTGATLAFQRPLVVQFLPLPRDGWHDLSLAVLLSSVSRVVAVPKPLIRYRIHADNATGLNFRPLWRRRDPDGAWLTNLTDQQRHWEQLSDRILASGHRGAGKRAGAKADFLRRRLHLPDRAAARIVRATALLATGDYHRYGNGAQTFLRDLVRS